MNSLDRNADLYLDVCQEFAIREFGERAIFEREPGHKIMTTRPAPQDGSPIRCFEVGERVWEEMEDFETGVVIVHNGKVSVSYPGQDVEHEGMTFQVGHPREVSELFHLLVNPALCITPGEEEAWSKRKLGDLVDFSILIPDGNDWRVMDLANPPVCVPQELHGQLFFNVSQDWDKLCMGKTAEAHKLAGQWADAIHALPSGGTQLLAGYLLAPNAGIRSGIDSAASGPAGNPLFFDLLLVPKDKEVSSLFLRELLGRDRETGKAIRKAFAAATSLASLQANLAGVELYMPVKYHHQIRVAAEHIMIREWLRVVTECLVDQRDCYHVQDDRQWHQAHVFSQMVNRNDC
jgi:hypothetical protein